VRHRFTEFRCPIRYGARLSQAFSATHPSITIKPEEIKEIPDVKDPSGNNVLSDGCAPCSPQLAEEIYTRLYNKAPPKDGDDDYDPYVLSLRSCLYLSLPCMARRTKFVPKAFQIRVGSSAH